MIEKNDEKAVVKCDGCGEVIYDGYMKEEQTRDACIIDSDHHYCDSCKDDSMTQEFRTCDHCGMPMIQGFTVEGGFWYCCEDCFEQVINEDYEVWRENDHKDDPYWIGGYYDWYDAREDAWHDTGIFYTEWY